MALFTIHYTLEIDDSMKAYNISLKQHA